MMKNWFLFTNKAAGVLDISIHQEIGSMGVSARQFMRELNEAEGIKVINLSIHSPGGNLLDGLAMYNALRAHDAKVYARVEGIAASAASVVLLAADTVSMPEDSFIMIHNPFTMAMGDGEELRSIAEVVDKMQASIVNVYERRTGMERDKIEALMKVETWINAVEALEMGFIDTISDKVDVAAKLAGYDHWFQSLPVESESDILRIESIETVNDFESFLRDAGKFSRKAANALVARSRAIHQSDSDLEDEDESLAPVLEALNKVKIPGSLVSA